MLQTNYLDTYFSRVNHMGTSTAQRIRNGGIRSYEKWLAESPHTIRNLTSERGLFFDGIILTSKDKQYEKIMFLNVALNVAIQIGDIINWKLDNGNIEKWIIIQEQKKVNGTYRTFWIVRCNYLMKWVDSNGHVQQSWSYFVSSLDSKIKGNFRTWNSLISPQPNKYAELLMPRYPIDRATNFIVEQQSWTVVEYDHTSVPGIIYLSLTEGKINSIYDDVTHNIADTDKIANYSILVPEQVQNFNIGDIVNPTFTLIKNGSPIKDQEPILLTSDNTAIVDIINDTLIAKAQGEANIVVTLKNYPFIKQLVSVKINTDELTFSAYISGPDSLRLDRQSAYTLKSTLPITGQVEFTIDQEYNNFIYIVKNHKNSNNVTCYVRANNKNNITEINKPCILKATYNGIVYKKAISVIPLW